mgnify:FL=1
MIVMLFKGCVLMVESKKFGYEKHNIDIISGTDKKRICGYFIVSDLHKVTDVDIRFRTQELLEEVAKHEDWILESIIWDANHKVDINREGLNTILEKAKNDEFDILLLHHVTIISRQGGKTFDYVLQLHRLDKSVYGIIDNIHSLDELVKSLHLSIPRQKQYEEL